MIAVGGMDQTLVGPTSQGEGDPSFFKVGNPSKCLFKGKDQFLSKNISFDPELGGLLGIVPFNFMPTPYESLSLNPESQILKKTR